MSDASTAASDGNQALDAQLRNASAASASRSGLAASQASKSARSPLSRNQPKPTRREADHFPAEIHKVLTFFQQTEK
ncbi:hypothetical protein [Lamprobacter modestohalophilus]|uniref:hypothetical protein n=1 Tax=Lamprobacter modestohalophilus TaxID=1064514 RepID=UPI0019070609|nr:hypothetical protein [Lamprobacter modestohalophilus]